jgi:cytochrome bd ubiquinol oxidase subunit I
VVVLGDESGYLANFDQRMKVAAMEGMWETEEAPASLTVIGFPSQAERVTKYKIEIPYLLGLIATRSLNEPVYGINDLVAQARVRIKSGMQAYAALKILQLNPNDAAAIKTLDFNQQNIGYGLLLQKFTLDPLNADAAQIEQAAWSTVPDVFTLFWSFRFMVACGLFFIGLFALTYYLCLTRRITHHRFLLRVILYSLPLPWLASELGWVVAEYGRQPWLVEGLLPTFLGVSSISVESVWLSLLGFVFFYTILAVVEVYLMVKYIRLGPDQLFKPSDFTTKSVSPNFAKSLGGNGDV